MKFKGIFILFGNAPMRRRSTLDVTIPLSNREKGPDGSGPCGHFVTISVDFLSGDAVVFDATGSQKSSRFTSTYFDVEAVEDGLQRVSDVVNYLSNRRLTSIKLKKGPLQRVQSAGSMDCGPIGKVSNIFMIRLSKSKQKCELFTKQNYIY